MTIISIKMEDADAEILHQLIINAEEEGEFSDAFDLKITKEDEANARLIASAPEMYELLCEILLEYEAEAKAEGWDLPTSGEMIRELLAKVEGGEG